MKTEYRLIGAFIALLVVGVYVFAIPAPVLFPFSHIVVTMLASLLGFLSALFLIPIQYTLVDELRKIAALAGISPELISEVITTGVSKVERIRNWNTSVKDQRVNLDIEKICTVADKIFENFRKTPGNVRQAKSFLNHYLDATAELVQKYVDLQEKNANSDKVKSVLAKFRESLAAIEELFERQYEKMLADEVLEFDVELDVFRNVMQSEEGITVKSKKS